MIGCLECKNKLTKTCRFCIAWSKYEPYGFITTTAGDISKDMLEIAKYATDDVFGVKIAYRDYGMAIKKVIFNNPATIVLWTDGTKTVVKCGEGELFDPEKGLAMAVAKKVFGNKGNYYETFKKWLPKNRETPASIAMTSDGLKINGKDIFEEINNGLARAGISTDPVPVVAKKLMTPEELAKISGCTKATIQKQCREGVYPNAVKVGGKWKIPYVERRKN